MSFFTILSIKIRVTSKSRPNYYLIWHIFPFDYNPNLFFLLKQLNTGHFANVIKLSALQVLRNIRALKLFINRTCSFKREIFNGLQNVERELKTTLFSRRNLKC